MTDSELSSVHDFIFHAAAQRSSLSLNIFSAEWTFLSQSEAKLIGLMDNNEPPASQPGDAEYGLILYWLQHGPLALPLKLLGMPPTRVSSSMYESWQSQVETGPGVVMRDGTLISTVKYATLDINWADAFLYYLRTRYAKDLPSFLFPINTHAFGGPPQPVSLTGASLKIAILGDWGTGVWADSESALCPAQLISEAIQQQSPDLVIHLGDVYYYGSSNQEQASMGTFWAGGAKGSLTLNSNHEMYDGANGYFDAALAYPAFKVQQGASYFAVIYSNWIIFGLDSAYFDQSALYSDGTVSDADQLSFISKVLAENGAPNTKIIVMTHHNAISYDGSQLNTYSGGSLMNDIYTALGNRIPDYWYYGHLHNGIVYDAAALGNSGIFNQFGAVPNLRCFGHAAIPFGKAYGLDGSPVANYFSQTPMPDPDTAQLNRVLNGFAMVTLQPGGITEQVYEVANDPSGSGIITTQVWP
ncbi:MAG: metallophosphoesterase family protein [Mucilaginibacter sp.]